MAAVARRDREPQFPAAARKSLLLLITARVHGLKSTGESVSLKDGDVCADL